MSKFVDLTGHKFGKLTVLERSTPFENYNRVFWVCKCDCGNILNVSSNSLKTGNTKSCGCSRKKLLDGESSLNKVFRGYKSNAKNRNINFEIKKEFFKKITKKNCYYCNSEPSNYRLEEHDISGYVYNGIDRLDNNIGYTEENCVPCCSDCNTMKMDLSRQDFLSWVERVYNHSIKGKEDV